MSETGPETGKNKHANATSFSKENPRPGPGRGKKKPRPPAGNTLLDDMRKAYSQSASPDDSPGVKEARKMLETDYTKFVTLYAKLGGDDSGGADAPEAQPVEAATAQAGPKEEAVDELIDRLLREWEVEDERHRAGRTPQG